MEYFLFETCWGGLLFLFLGIGVLFYVIKYTEKDTDSSPLQPYIKGILAGIFLIMGVTSLYNTIFG